MMRITTTRLEEMTRRGPAWHVMRVLVLTVTSFVASGCIGDTPRPKDGQTTRDFVLETWGIQSSKCDRPVDVIPAHTALGRPSRELANLSASCFVSSIWMCEHRLKERACALGADAVLLTEVEPGPQPAGGSRQSTLFRSGRAVRWVD